MLPIHQIKPELVSALQKSARLIVQAPTGSGKSTQVPQMLVDEGLVGEGIVLVLQPRRLAARLLACRVAEERGSAVGQEVGFQIRMERVASDATRLLYITEGVLPRMLLHNPQLKGVSAILFDEFHERHLDGDVALGLTRRLQETHRPDLKLIVMSATLQMEALQQWFAPCEMLESHGRMFPVNIQYLPKEPDWQRQSVWDVASQSVKRLVDQGVEGDVLVFMPGAYEIHRTLESLRNLLGSQSNMLLPLHGELPLEQQQAAMKRYDQRKIIVATNVAETSLTIDGVRVVVDSGLAKVARFDPYRGINTLLVEKISMASADQRAGRAGRTAEGICLRLWAEKSPRKAHESSEVHRLDLSETVLMLKSLGVESVENFAWFESPGELSLKNAMELLYRLGALDQEQKLTEIGKKMAQFPMHPRMSRMLIEAEARRCVPSACLVAGLFHERSLWVRQPKMQALRAEEERSDFFAMMRAWEIARERNFELAECERLGIHARTARQVERLRDQFLSIAKRCGLALDEEGNWESLQKCIMVGWLDHLAKRCDGGTLRCTMLDEKVGWVSEHSSIQHAPLLVSAEVRETHVRGTLKTLLSQNTAVKEEWLAEVSPQFFQSTQELVFDAHARKVIRRQSKAFLDLVLEEKDADAMPDSQAALILAQGILKHELHLSGWDDAVDQWLVRLNCLAQWMPELELPAFGEEDKIFLLSQLCQNCTTYKQVKDKPIKPVLKDWLSATQLGYLDQFAPERLPLPNGKQAKVRYAHGMAPTLSARIQELYDLRTPVKLANGAVEVRFEILAPNFRPVQITDNLQNFWKETYPQLKPELARRYPKHEWR